MIRKLPSLIQTFRQALIVYAKVYFEILPILLLYVIAQCALNVFLPVREDLSLNFFSRLFIDMAVSALFFSCVITLIMKRAQGEPGTLKTSVQFGFARFFSSLIAYGFISLPVILMLVGIKLSIIYLALSSLSAPLLFSLILASIVFSLILSAYCFIAGVLIVVERQGVFQALKNSAKNMRGHIIDTLLIIIVLGMATVALTLLLDNELYPVADNLKTAVITLVMSGLYPVMMAIRAVQVGVMDGALFVTDPKPL